MTLAASWFNLVHGNVKSSSPSAWNTGYKSSYSFFFFFLPQLDTKYDPVLEAEARDWLEAVVGEPFPKAGSFHEALKDGAYLCKAMNILEPSSNIKINTSKMAFKMVSFSRAFI